MRQPLDDLPDDRLADALTFLAFLRFHHNWVTLDCCPTWMVATDLESAGLVRIVCLETVDPDTGTARYRIELPNRGGAIA